MDILLSNKISTARVICILSLIYVHFPPFYGEIKDINNFIEYFTIFISNLVGRSSVPLLSVVSGFLIVTSIQKYNYTNLLKNKITTLLIPLLVWNLTSLIKDLIVDNSPLENKNILNYLLSIYDTPGILPLYFLRDIFVCVAFSPLLLKCTSGMKSYIIMLLLIVLSTLNLYNNLFINNTIIIFFFLGIIIANEKQIYLEKFENGKLFITSLTSLIIITNILIIIKPVNLSYEAQTLISLSSRFLGAIIFWNIACFLTNRFNVGKYSSIIFFTFCSHTLIISIIWSIAKYFDIKPITYSYITLFILSPILVFIISLMIYKPFRHFCPKAQILWTGRK